MYEFYSGEIVRSTSVDYIPWWSGYSSSTEKYPNLKCIYIKVFPYGTVCHLIVSTDDVLNTTNNVTYFPNSEKSFKNNLRLKYNENMSLNNRILGLQYILLVLVI